MHHTATTQIYTLSLHDALPIFLAVFARYYGAEPNLVERSAAPDRLDFRQFRHRQTARRSEEHTSELQSRRDLVCRLLLEKKKTAPASTSPAFAHALSPHHLLSA